MTPKSTRTISWLLYPEVTDYTALLTVICALYYLPEKYHLLVAADEASVAMLMPPDHETIEHRIHFTQKDSSTWKAAIEARSRALLFDQAYVVPKNENSSQPPVIVIRQASLNSDSKQNSSNELSADKPEGLASVVLLHIAR